MPTPSPKWEQSLKDLEDEFRRLVQALDLIVTLDRRIFQTSFDLDGLLQEMLKGLRDLVGAEYAQILLRRGPALVIMHSTQTTDKDRALRIDECVCGLAVMRKETVASGNVERDFPELYTRILGNEKTQKMVSEVAVPIYAAVMQENTTDSGFADQLVSGVINIESPLADAFHRSQIELVEKFALQAGAAINNARIHTGLALTLELAENITTLTEQPGTALRNTLERLSALFQSGVVVQFLIYDRASNSLLIESSTLEGTEGQNVLVDDSFSGLVVRESRAILSNNVQHDYPNLFKDTVGDAGFSPTQSELAVPIKEDSQIIGVLNVESPELDAFSLYDQYMLTVIASNASLWRRIHRTKSTLALQKMATMGTIAGHLIHTLNSGLFPLEKIANNLQEICDRGEPDNQMGLATQIDWLRSIGPSIKASINDLKDMYEKTEVSAQGVDINSEARTVAEKVITREDIKMIWDLDNDMPNLRISRGIYHVFWNLLSNAQYAIKEDLPGEIKVSTRILFGHYTRKIEAFEISVEDNGRGIPKEKQQQVFQLDYSTKEGRITGYGLWWVNTFVDLWDGKIELKSEVNKGTTIKAWFPLKPDGVATHRLEGENV